MPRRWNPFRVWRVLRLLVTVFLLIRRQKSLFFLRPLAPGPFREEILSLGVSFIKLAQVLATRADFFTEDYLRELRKVHDELPAMDEWALKSSMKAAFGKTPPFRSFEETPIASATIGQVHRAFLADGTEVAVKLRRWGVERLIRDDISILSAILYVLRPFLSNQTRNSIDAVISEFSAMIVREADLQIELENLKKFRKDYHCEGIAFPDFYEEYSNSHVLVMTFVHGVRIDDREAVERLGISGEEIVRRLVLFYTEQMLIRGFFHSDPHPGNILVREDGILVFLDFGMVKRISSGTRIAMIEMAKSAHERDYERYIAACKRLGVVSASAPDAVMYEFSERMFDIFSSEHLTSASMQALAFEVLASMRIFPFKLPPDVVYVTRASSLVEGLGTVYIENFNGVKDILPILVKNLPRALGAETSLVHAALQEAMDLPLTVHRAKTLLANLSEGNQYIRISPETLEIVSDWVRASLRPLVSGILIIMCAFFLLALGIPCAKAWASALFVLGSIRLLSAIR